jgi:hypothetical protein
LLDTINKKKTKIFVFLQMLQLAKILALLLVNIDFSSILFIFNFFLIFLFISLPIFLGLIFNYDFFLNGEYLSLVSALLINRINDNIP